MSWHKSPISEHVQKVRSWNPLKSGSTDTFSYIDLSSVDKDKKQIESGEVLELLPVNAPGRARQLVRGGDVLVATVRPNLNGVARVPESLDGATASTGYCVLRANDETLDSDYLFYWVQTNSFVRDMMSKATGANYPAVSDRTIKSSKIPLPPLKEQKRIAAILDGSDWVAEVDAYCRYCRRGFSVAEDLINYFWAYPVFFGYLMRGSMRRDIIRLLGSDIHTEEELPAIASMRRALRRRVPA